MTRRGVILLHLFLFFMVAKADFQCITASDFNKKHSSLGDEVFRSYKTNVTRDDYHKFLFDSGISLHPQALDQIKVLEGLEPKTRIKQMFLSEAIKKENAEREVKNLREICGVTEKDVSMSNRCKSPFVADYYGCVVDSKAVYLFQEHTILSLFDVKFRQLYRFSKPLHRIGIMLDVIDRFIELHELGFVHSNIKPENILTDTYENFEFKITGFKYANRKGEIFMGGTLGYVAPERCVKNYKKDLLSFTEDVFSLAMTFAEIEEGFTTPSVFANDGCFNYEHKLPECKDKIFKGLDNIFSEKKGLRSLLPVFEEALSFDPKLRYPTMKKFSLAILDKFKALEGAKEFADDMKKIKDSKSLEKKTRSFWIDQIPCFNFFTNPFFRFLTDIYHKIKLPKFCENIESNNKFATGQKGEKNMALAPANENEKKTIL